MEEQQEAIVLEVTGEMARVKASRHSHCDNCGSCPGNLALVLDARNPLGAKPGQRVLLEIKEVNMLKAAFIVYVLPLILLFAGAVGGGMLGERFGSSSVAWNVIGGIVAFLVGVIYVKYFDNNARNNEKMQPVIVRILSD